MAEGPTVEFSDVFVVRETETALLCRIGDARRTVELFPEVAQLLREIQPLRVTPEMPVFTTGAAATPPPQHPSRYGPALARGSAKSFARSSRS